MAISTLRDIARSRLRSASRDVGPHAGGANGWAARIEGGMRSARYCGSRKPRLKLSAIPAQDPRAHTAPQALWSRYENAGAHVDELRQG
jgi:hypothetical protein